MKRLTLSGLIIALLLTVALALTSCSTTIWDIVGEPTVCTEHTDSDADGKCDTCGEKVEIPAPECTAHTDKNNDGKCDTCGADVKPAGTGCTHTDNTGDGKCDTCGEYITITVKEALELCGAAGNVTKERYYIRATVKTVTNAEYGAMIIEDETGEIAVYGTYSADGEIGYKDMTDKPYKGDTVLLHCILQNYNGTKEVKNARLIEFSHAENVYNEADYKSATVNEARAAKVGDKLKVSGVVARITYSNGMKPSGFILVDTTGSIYVYGADAAQRVSVGNTVTVAASKTYWILDSEKANAEKYGYGGCNQLEDPYLINNDEKTSEFSEAAATAATVKSVYKTPVTEDITTKLYKSVALISKVPGNGFVNYYINDLDYESSENPGTGSYCYTQCNGSDLAWLDEFDGKICTVYYVVINAKSTATGCAWRFLPVKVVDEGFEWSIDDTAEHVVNYYGLDQFAKSYTADPALELITSVSSTLLGFEGAELSYASSDEAVVKFTTADGKTVMNLVGYGKATVTVTATHGGKTHSKTLEITYSQPESYATVTVGDAIAAAVGETLTVKGIVGPSLANQSGFYLIDESGAIPIRMAKDVVATLKLGSEIIIRGEKTITKDGGGQICIDNCELLQNNLGSHEYSDATFIKGKTLGDVIALDSSVENTLKIYVITAKIKRVATAHSTNTYVVSGTDEFMLYAGGAGDYAWLEDYVDTELTIELAVCDWNNKGNKGCILSVTTSDGTKIYNTLKLAK